MNDIMKEEKIRPFEKDLFKLLREHFDFNNYWWDLKCVHNKEEGIISGINVNITIKKEDK
tara:strand:- start:5948 stop:6127 length:180 start_codon:yes stop_codon:yes gene_type:complete